MLRPGPPAAGDPTPKPTPPAGSWSEPEYRERMQTDLDKLHPDPGSPSMRGSATPWRNTPRIRKGIQVSDPGDPARILTRIPKIRRGSGSWIRKILRRSGADPDQDPEDPPEIRRGTEPLRWYGAVRVPPPLRPCGGRPSGGTRPGVPARVRSPELIGMRGPMPAPRRRSPACGLAGVGRSVGRRRGLRSRPVGPGLAALRGAAARAAAVSGPRPPSSGRPGPLGLSARGPRPSRRGVQPPRGRRCGVGGPGPRRPWLAGRSVPGPVGRGGRSPPSRSAL